MTRPLAVVGLGVGLIACAKEAPPPPPAGADAAPAPATAENATGSATEPAVATPWWKQDAPCPDGARLDAGDDGRRYRCVTDDGTPHGKAVSLHANGAKRAEGRYVDGKRDGIWSQWSADGQLLGTFSMRAGSGTLIEWFDDGSPRFEVTYVDGEKSGPYREYHPGRKLRWQRAYEAGKPVGGWQQWSRDGKLLGSLTFSKGSGRYAEWNDDGTVAVEGQFRDGAYDGTWSWRWTAETDGEKVPVEHRRIYRRGKVVALRMFRDGKEVKSADDARSLAEHHARSSGVLGTLSSSGAVASVFGNADFSTGLDDRSAFGGLTGDQLGDAQGGFGFGLEGTGPGGGGSGVGNIGHGKVGAIGGGLGDKRETSPKTRFGNAQVSGALDKNIIRRYVRRQLRRIQFCYDKELAKNPKLEGTVRVRFTIMPTGAVGQAAASGMRNTALEGCIAAAVRSIQFPQPKGGGLVEVVYPFTLTPR